MLDSHSASFTRSDEGYFGCDYAASFHRAGNAPRVDGEQTQTSLDARGVAHAVKQINESSSR